MEFNTSNWEQDSLVLTQKGYRVLKSALSKGQEDWIRRTLTVKPETPEKYDMGKTSFPYFMNRSFIFIYLVTGH